MTKRILAVVGLLLLVSSSAGATGGVATDGFWWNVLPSGAKNDIVAGATSAYEAGWRAGLLAAERNGLDSISATPGFNDTQKATLKRQFGNAMISTLRTQAPDFEGKPIRTYVEGVDDFYFKHDDAVKMDFAAVFACVQNRPKKTCDAVASEFRRGR